MPNAAPTLIALDFDGVLNVFSKNAPVPLKKATIGGWPVQWRPEVLERLKAVLALPGVEGAWLTTWLEEPVLLDEVERVLGLEGLVPHRAEHPAVKSADGRVLVNDLFPEGASTSPVTGRWWKYRAIELLIERLGPARVAWLDDDLGRAAGMPGNPWRPGQRPERLALRTHANAGLLPGDMTRLEEWISAGQPSHARDLEPDFRASTEMDREPWGGGYVVTARVPISEEHALAEWRKRYPR
jgi:hypothetical protein